MADRAYAFFPSEQARKLLQKRGAARVAATDKPHEIVNERIREPRGIAEDESATVGQPLLDPADLRTQLRQDMGEIALQRMQIVIGTEVQPPSILGKLRRKLVSLRAQHQRQGQRK